VDRADLFKNAQRFPDLVAAIREEMAAARDGPTPTHRVLRELGYWGWSQLLAYRPEGL
jgi:hypothetical protein